MTLQSLGTFTGNGDTLARMVAKGLCTIDDLDHRPPGADISYNPKNMLRDWIKVNVAKWQEIQNEYSFVADPAIEAGPSPRDFFTKNVPF